MTESDKLAFWTGLLNLNGCVVCSHSETAEAHRFVVASPAVGCCADCGGHCVRVQKRQAGKPIADLPILGKRYGWCFGVISSDAPIAGNVLHQRMHWCRQ